MEQTTANNPFPLNFFILLRLCARSILSIIDYRLSIISYPIHFFRSHNAFWPTISSKQPLTIPSLLKFIQFTRACDQFWRSMPSCIRLILYFHFISQMSISLFNFSQHIFFIKTLSICSPRVFRLIGVLSSQAAEDPIDWPAYYSLFIRLFILVNVLTLWMVKLVCADCLPSPEKLWQSPHT